jgi:hypothetical protein
MARLESEVPSFGGKSGVGLFVNMLNLVFHTSFLSHFVFLHSVRRLLVTANVVPSSLILVTLMMEFL